MISVVGKNHHRENKITQTQGHNVETKKSEKKSRLLSNDNH